MPSSDKDGKADRSEAAAKVRQDFLAKGLASAEKARRTGVYHSASDVLARLERILAECGRA